MKILFLQRPITDGVELQAEFNLRVRSQLRGAANTDIGVKCAKERMAEQIKHACREYEPETLTDRDKVIICRALSMYNMSRMSSANLTESLNDSVCMLSIFDFEKWVKEEYRS